MLADGGEKAAVRVEDAELGKALGDFVRQYPGQEKEVWEYYRKNPQALAQIRAPLFEEKVVDHIIAQAKVSERTVGRDDLFRVESEDPAAKPKAAAESAPAVNEAETAAE